MAPAFPSATRQTVYVFGPFRLDPARRKLWRGQTAIQLPARSFDTLQCLVENAGRVVERDELMRAVWGGRIVEDANLKQTVYLLRKSLRAPAGDDVIAAIPSRGYRLTAPVQCANDASPARHSSLGFRRLAAAAALCAIVAGAAALIRSDLPARRAAPAAPSVAVLPFADFSGDPAHAYLAKGVAAALIEALGRAPALRVAARTSSFAFQGTGLTAPDIARRLNVAAVLEGEVRRDGQRWDLALNLVAANTGYAVWSRTEELDGDGVPGEAARLATHVAAALGAAMPPPPEAASGGARDPAAFDAYLHGLAAVAGADTAAGHAAARAAFAAAIARDPDFAAAHAALAEELALQVEFATSGDPGAARAGLAQARAEAARAIELAPALGSAHRALAKTLMVANDFAAAGREIALARAAAPGDARTLAYAAALDMALGRASDAVRTATALTERDPMTPDAFVTLAEAQRAARQYDAALVSLHRARILGAGPELAAVEGMIALARGDDAEAQRRCRTIPGWERHFCVAIAAWRLGIVAEAEAERRALVAALNDSGAFQYAEIDAQWRHPEAALRWLAKAYDLHDPGLIALRTDPLLDPIRATPGFTLIADRLNPPR